jgi:hypothetical protein
LSARHIVDGCRGKLRAQALKYGNRVSGNAVVVAQQYLGLV